MPPEQTVKRFIGKSLKDPGKGWHVCDQALHALGCCTTTTPCHTAVSINEFWQENKHSCGSSAPSIRRISVPVTSFLFPRLKNHLKGCHFDTLDNIQKSITDKLKGTCIPAEVSQHCYEQWKQCFLCCIAAQENYFEGDNLDL